MCFIIPIRLRDLNSYGSQSGNIKNCRARSTYLHNVYGTLVFIICVLHNIFNMIKIKELVLFYRLKSINYPFKWDKYEWGLFNSRYYNRNNPTIHYCVISDNAMELNTRRQFWYKFSDDLFSFDIFNTNWMLITLFICWYH